MFLFRIFRKPARPIPKNTNRELSEAEWARIKLLDQKIRERNQPRRLGDSRSPVPTIDREEWLEKWEADREAEKEAIQNFSVTELRAEVKQRQQEQEMIRTDFPLWFVDFATKYNAYSYNDVASLADYVISILKYASEKFGERMPIRKCTEAADDGLIGELPNLSCSSRLFFERLSKILVTNGLLLGGNNQGPKGRKIAPDAVEKLRPASSVQRKTRPAA